MHKTVRLKYSEKRSIQITITVITSLCVVFCLIPLFMTIINSAKSNYEIRTSIFALPKKINFANYSKAFSEIGGNILGSS